MTQASYEAITNSLLKQWDHKPENLLQILIGIQHNLAQIPDPVIKILSSDLKLPVVQIEAVISFYSFLHRHNQGRYCVLFSDNIIDRMLGSQALARRLANSLSINLNTPSELATIGYTSCTGMGDQGPAALINGRAITRLDEKRIDTIAELIRTETPLNQWPTEFFQVTENIKRKDALFNTPFESGAALQALKSSGAEALLDEIDESGLMGRGGAGFKTEIKWKICRKATGQEHIVVCNADEGEPGTFKDRLLLQSYADRLIEGMTLCAATINARQGFIYLRGEYLHLLDDLEAELQRRRDSGLLGKNILNQSGFNFDIQIHLGAGAYVCGEESALIESLEGRRGIPRIRPPFPVTQGYLGHPTVVNNVETFVAAAMIAQHGVAWYRATGTDQSPGTKLISVSGDCERPGIYEYPFGVTIQQILNDCGASETQAVQVAGAAGVCLPPDEFNRTIAFEDVPTGGSFMVFNNERSLLEAAHNFTDFFVHESCGFCTPCRVGSSLLKKRLEKVLVKHATREDLETMRTLGELMRNASQCGLGQTAANPILSLLDKFPEIFRGHLRSTSFEPAFDLDAALEEARALTNRNDPKAHLEGGGV